MLATLILSIAVWTATLHAEDESIPIESLQIEAPVNTPIQRRWKLLMAAGHFGEHKRSVDAESYDNNSQLLLNYGIEAGSYQYTISYYKTEKNSETGNFLISSRRRTWLLGAQYIVKDSSFWSPVVGANVGLYKESVQTQFGTLDKNIESESLLLAGISAGIQFQFLKVMYSDLLFKVIKRESAKEMEFASQATLGLRL